MWLVAWLRLRGGSSPRGRGKRVGQQQFHGGNRLIPARAGKTLGSMMRFDSPWAHPRAGGENKPRV